MLNVPNIRPFFSRFFFYFCRHYSSPHTQTQTHSQHTEHICAHRIWSYCCHSYPLHTMWEREHSVGVESERAPTQSTKEQWQSEIEHINFDENRMKWINEREIVMLRQCVRSHGESKHVISTFLSRFYSRWTVCADGKYFKFHLTKIYAYNYVNDLIYSCTRAQLNRWQSRMRGPRPELIQKEIKMHLIIICVVCLCSIRSFLLATPIY